MKKVIVTTTINPPTKAIKKFDMLKEWTLIVIGDKKTPPNYKLTRGIYVSPKEQEKYDKKLSEAIGWNSVQRRNFGILLAYDMGADIIALADDDNIPTEEWGKNLLLGKKTKVNYYSTTLPVFDPVGATNYPHLWHRGFPLQLISQRDYSNKKEGYIIPDIQADFWNGTPDVDAFCNMEYKPSCTFKEKYFPMASNVLTPFNSQNSFITRAVAKEYFLFPHIGRMHDIWAAFYVQAKGFCVVFNKPSVFHDRNIHNPIDDMRAEYLAYQYSLELAEKIIENPSSILEYLPEKSIKAWGLYNKHIK